jgi:hypothetical protein
MFYACIKNNRVISILNRAPENADAIVAISDEECDSILLSKTHYIDVENKKVARLPAAAPRQQYIEIDQDEINTEMQQFLSDTDWKVLRHIRQLALGKSTSLSDEEYQDLETAREAAASKIVQC